MKIKVIQFDGKGQTVDVSNGRLYKKLISYLNVDRWPEVLDNVISENCLAFYEYL